MNAKEKIHLLSRELIPVMDDLDEDTIGVVQEHIGECSECKKLYDSVMKMEENYSQGALTNDVVAIKPLKKLIQFNQGLKLLFLFIRVIFLLFIVYSATQFYDWETSAQAAIHYIKNVIFYFYFPAMLFLNIFSLLFFNKKWTFIAVCFDVIILLFFDLFIKFFV